MNNDEQQLINQFFERVSGKNLAASNTVGTANPLPPIDSEANQLINSNLQKYPEAGYRMTQMAIVQEAALVESQNRIRQLEWQLQQMQQQIQQLKQAQQNQPRSGGGFLGGLFGGGNSQQPQAQSQQMPPGWGGNPNRPQSPQNQPMNMPYGQQQSPGVNYPPGYQRGMFNRSGNGFLGSALSTAAGVAGGMMAYNALSGLFSDHHAAGNMASMPAADSSDPFTGAAAGSDPFTDSGAAVDPNFDAGNNTGAGFDNSFSDSGSDSGWGDFGDSGADTGGDWGGDDGGWGDDSF